MSGRLLLIGLGDLGRRLAERLAACADVDELILAGRARAGLDEFARLLDASSDGAVRFTLLDASRPDAVAAVLSEQRPDLVVHCASLLSPWHLATRHDAVGAALRRAGFAVQLPAQLPLLLSVMTGVRAAGFLGPVVNCSYPDVTHPVLQCLRLAPTLGVGNVGMVRLRAMSALRDRRGPGRRVPPLVRVAAHHAHVSAVMRAEPGESEVDRPRVYLGETGDRADELAYAGVALPADSRLNLLTAASALPVLRALLPGTEPVRTSVPGPLGLPGGFPVILDTGRLTLDLPVTAGLDETVAFQRAAARGDGVAAIADDGTVSFTDALRDAVRPIDPEMAESMHPTQAWDRFSRLAAVLRR